MAAARETRLSKSEEQLASRLLRARNHLGLTLTVFGQLFGCNSSHLYKLEAGLTRITKERVVILELVELALQRQPPHRVWSPEDVTTPQRLARVCRCAFPDLEVVVVVEENRR